MKKLFTTTLVFTVATLAAGQVMAQTSPAMGKTREEVRTELNQAQRKGSTAVGNNVGDVTDLGVAPAGAGKFNEEDPNRYPAVTVSSSKTRAQVHAELLEAQRTGDIAVSDSFTDPSGLGTGLGLGSGNKVKDLYPNRYPATPVSAGKTRAQVQAELMEAQRTGDIAVGDRFTDPSGLGTGFGYGEGNLLKDRHPNRYPSSY